MFGGIGSNGSLGMGIIMSLQDNFSGTSKTIENSMESLEKVTDSVTQKVTKGLSMMAAGMKTFAIGAALSIPFVMAIDKAMDFEHALSSVKAVTGATANEMERIRGLTLKVGGEFGFSATESAKGVEELAKAGVDFKVIMNGGLRDAFILARAGELSVGEAAEIASGALNAFRKDNMTLGQAANYMAGAANASAISMKDVAAAMPYISSAAANVGLSFKDVNVGLATLGQNYIKGSQAGTTFANFLSHLIPTQMQQLAYMEKWGLGTAQIIKGQDGMRKTIGQVSSAFYDQTGKIKPLAEVAQLLHDKFKNLSSMQRAAEFKHLFGDEGVRAAIVLFEQGAKGVNDMAEAMKKVTAEQVAQERMSNLIGSWERFKAALYNTAIIVGTMFLPVLNSITTTMTKVVNAFTWFADTVLGSIILKVLAATSVLLMFVGALLIIKGAIVAVTAIMPAFIASIWAAMAPLLPLVAALAVVAGGIYLVKKSYDEFISVMEGKSKVAEGFVGFMQRIGGIVWGVIQVFKSWDGTTFDLGGMEETFQKLGILDQMKAIATWVVRIIELFKGFGEGISWAFGLIKTQWVGFKKDMSSLFDNLGISVGKLGIKVEWFHKIGKMLGMLIGGPIVAAFTIVRFAIEGVAIVVGGLSAVFYGLYQAVSWAITGIWDLFHSFNLMDALEGALNGLMDIGRNIINGIFEGIKSGWHMIEEWIIEKINAISELNPFTSTSNAGNISPVGGGVARNIDQNVSTIQMLKSNPGSNSYQTTHVTQRAPNQQAVVNIHLDKDKIGAAVVDWQNDQDERE